MNTNPQLEQLKVESGQIMDQLKWLIHEGNVRRIIITQNEGDVVAEFPLTVGVIGTLFAPVVAAIGAIIALLADCRIYIERSETTTTTVEQPEEVEPVAAG
jgi:Domain of unknown function (DUF4342)